MTAVAHRLRRVTAGRWHDGSQREASGTRGLWVYVANELPSPLPEGATIVERWATNWDGGPPQVTRLAVIDSDLPQELSHLVVGRATRCILLAHERLRVWWPAAGELSMVTWYEPSPDGADRAAARQRDDALGPLQQIMAELADKNESTPGAFHARWQQLATAGVAFPEAFEDPYGAHGPDGPPTIPAAWRHQPLATLASPFEPLAELASLDIGALSLGPEEAAITLPSVMDAR